MIGALASFTSCFSVHSKAVGGHMAVFCIYQMNTCNAIAMAPILLLVLCTYFY